LGEIDKPVMIKRGISGTIEELLNWMKLRLDTTNWRKELRNDLNK
jgi:3-deoxy-D-arabino-heptulosonate 7-phosphate (DAHP) synthase